MIRMIRGDRDGGSGGGGWIKECWLQLRLSLLGCKIVYLYLFWSSTKQIYLYL